MTISLSVTPAIALLSLCSMICSSCLLYNLIKRKLDNSADDEESQRLLDNDEAAQLDNDRNSLASVATTAGASALPPPVEMKSIIKKTDKGEKQKH
jgi:hypothetical protein